MYTVFHSVNQQSTFNQKCYKNGLIKTNALLERTNKVCLNYPIADNYLTFIKYIKVYYLGVIRSANLINSCFT